MKNKDLKMGICENLVYMMYNLQNLNWRLTASVSISAREKCFQGLLRSVTTASLFKPISIFTFAQTCDSSPPVRVSLCSLRFCSAGKCMSFLLCVSVEVN